MLRLVGKVALITGDLRLAAAQVMGVDGGLLSHMPDFAEELEQR